MSGCESAECRSAPWSEVWRPGTLLVDRFLGIHAREVASGRTTMGTLRFTLRPAAVPARLLAFLVRDVLGASRRALADSFRVAGELCVTTGSRLGVMALKGLPVGLRGAVLALTVAGGIGRPAVLALARRARLVLGVAVCLASHLAPPRCCQPSGRG